MNECPAPGVQFHGVSKFSCKGAFPAFQIQKNLNMKYENERTASCVALVEVREMLLLAFSCLKNNGKKERKKRKNKIGNGTPKTYIVVLGFL